MYFNQIMFGKKIKNLRSKLGLSQIQVSDKTGISIKTIQNLEQGKVIPKSDTLEILSTILIEDLNSLLLRYRVDKFDMLHSTKTNLENKIDNNCFDKLDDEVDKLKKLKQEINNPYYKLLIEQLLIFTKAICVYRSDGDIDLAIDIFINAMKITIPDFDLSKYNSFYYTEMELRILMNIAMVQNRLGAKDKYLEMLEFCINNINPDHGLFPKICHNLSNAYARQKNYKSSIKYAELGIEYCKKNNVIQGLIYLYYSKGFGEFHLADDEYIKSIKLAISICEALDQHNFKEKIINNFKTILGSEYDFQASSIFS